jgi:protein-S-isoprenylcysteine O-methyltransferase Ste14
VFLRALLAFLVLPGVVAFIIPPLLAAIDPWRREAFLPGALVMLLGVVLVLWCVRDFYVSGKGTLAPWDPPAKLVVVGLYRYMRNPMYVGVVTLVLGWSLLLTSPVLVCYTPSWPSASTFGY